ncbi:MAG: patatin-like phospholipase family protein [Microterricola sp.]
MNTTPSSAPHPATTTTVGERALVVGGGGSTGNAWLIGVIAGLFDAGLDVTAADVTIGTSAGSTAAAQLAGATPPELYAAILAAAQPPSGTAGATPGVARERSSNKPVTDHLDRMRALIASAEDAADMRRRMGAAALERDAVSGDTWQQQWRATVASRLPSQHWPERRVLITAVDAESGDPAVFDRDSGVELADAVAASCSSSFAFTIGEHRYIDGGYRSNADNADLAAGYRRVLVLAPFGGRSLTPVGWGTHLSTQLDELRAHGSTVETVVPGSDVEHLFGANAMDLSLRPPAARSGYELGRARAERLAELWR